MCKWKMEKETVDEIEKVGSHLMCSHVARLSP